MKELKIPTINELAQAYAEIQKNKGSITEQRIAELATWSRFDPRLLEQLIQYVTKHWQNLSPIQLNFAARATAWPATLGVLLEQVRLSFSTTHTSPLFTGWMNCATADLPPGDGGLYFIGLTSLGGKMAWREASRASIPFTRWGWLWSELQVKVKPGAGLRLLPLHSRENIARDLASRLQRFTIGDYLDACGNQLGKRQAERDLQNFSFLQSSGATKARVYLKKNRARKN